MDELRSSSRVFEAASRLQDAADSLRRLGTGDVLQQWESETLQWSGVFLTVVDWDSDPTESSTSRLSDQATASRPSFYDALITMAPRLGEVGISSSEQLRSFLSRFYCVLRSARLSNRLTAEELRIASDFLEGLSQDLLGQLTNYGAPYDHGDLRTNAFSR